MIPRAISNTLRKKVEGKRVQVALEKGGWILCGTAGMTDTGTEKSSEIVSLCVGGIAH